MSAELIEQTLAKQTPSRIVALGSSNTERGAHSEGKYHWFDWLDLGLKRQFGSKHHSINVGISGETTSQLLARFDSAVEVYKPHIVLLTVGGNDSNPERQIDPDLFRKQLTELVQRIQGLGALCILQTYYSIVEEEMDPLYFKQFHDYMQIIREVAEEENTLLHDNLKRWELLRLQAPEVYKPLMRDAMHVKPLGNMLWGMDIARFFGVWINDLLSEWCEEGLQLQQQIDKMELAHAD